MRIRRSFRCYDRTRTVPVNLRREDMDAIFIVSRRRGLSARRWTTDVLVAALHDARWVESRAA
jgi:hypothetical protein